MTEENYRGSELAAGLQELPAIHDSSSPGSVPTLLGLGRQRDFDRALALIEAQGGQATRDDGFEDAAGLVGWYANTVRRGAMTENLEQAVAHVVRLEQKGYGRLLSWAYSTVGLGIGRVGDLVTGLQWVAKAVEIERQSGDALRLSWAMANQASLMSISKQFQLALTTFAQATQLISASEDPLRCGVLNNMASTALYWTLVLEPSDPTVKTLAKQALKHSEEAMAASQPDDRPYWRGWSQTNRGHALCLLGRAAEAEDAFRDAIEATRSSPRFQVGAIVGYSKLLVDTGRLDEAQSWLDRAAPLVLDDLLSNSMEQFLATQARVCLMRGEHSKAQDWFDRRFRVIEQRQQARLSHTLSQAKTLAQLEQARQSAEQAQAHARLMDAASNAKSGMLAQMSHEIRTPLHAIIGLAQLLEADDHDAEQSERVQGIREASHSLLQIVNDILDLSKVEAGAVQLSRRPFSLVEVVDRVTRILSSSAASKSLQIRVKTESCDGLAVVGDPDRLQQVLVNLMGNAIKFTSKGWVEIGARVLELDERVVKVRLEVCDSGKGIAPESLGRLFQPFAQAHLEDSGRTEGTGLGLAICRRLVEMMGGRIGAQSEVGQGSCFWFELEWPVAAPGAVGMPGATVAASVSDGRRPRLAGLRVLAADDNRLNRLVIRRLLEREGATAETSENGRQALDELQRRPDDFDVVLLDLHMPEMDGLQTLRAIMDEPMLCELPVVALTASVLGSDRDSAMAAGARGFILKPLEVEPMVRTLLPFRRNLQ